MNLSGFKIGDRAMIVARNEFYAYVDGWRGRVIGFDSGAVVLVGPGMGDAGQSTDPATPNITLFVPADELSHTV
jgi:hypothetical protein